MPANPERASRGGDVTGECKTDNQWGVGSATTVADASYEPGYEFGGTLKDGGWSVSKADIKQGYCSYGVGIGEGRPSGMIGGKK
jgi:hypothetical protein